MRGSRVKGGEWGDQKVSLSIPGNNSWRFEVSIKVLGLMETSKNYEHFLDSRIGHAVAGS